MKTIKKLISIVLILGILLPVNLVNAKTKEELFLEKLENMLKTSGCTLTKTDSEIEIDWESVSSDMTTLSYNYDNNVISYISGTIDTYEKAEDDVAHSFNFIYIIFGSLLANGYSEEEIMNRISDDTFKFDYDRNGIEIKETGSKITISDESSSLDVTPVSMKIDITKANLLKEGTFTPKTTTIDDVVDALNNYSSFKSSSYEGKVYSESEAYADDDGIYLQMTSYFYNQHNVLFDYDDGVITYEDGDIEDYNDAIKASSSHLFMTIFIYTALEVNGYTSEEIQNFIKEATDISYEVNYIEFKEIGEPKKYTSEDGREATTLSPISFKIDINNARIKRTYNILEGANKKLSITNNYSIKTDISNELLNNAKVYIDDKEIDSKYYEVKDSTITIKSTYIKNLSIKEHSIKIKVSDGEVSTTFTLIKNPQTGDTILKSILLSVLSIITISGSIIYLRKHKKN